MTFFITFGAPDPASVLLADLGACWALVFLAIAALFPPRRPTSRRQAVKVMAQRRAFKARWAA